MTPEQTLKQLMIAAPPDQLDPAAQEIIQKWDDEPTAIQIFEVLDKAVRYAWASGFALTVLGTFLDLRMKLEGLSQEELEALATWRTADEG